MLQSRSFITAALLCLYCVVTADAAEIPAPRDVVYPGTLTLSVDLTDVERRLFAVRQSLPVKPGPLTLLYPQWLPGTHGPTGPVNLLTGLVMTARGRRLPWMRDPLNVYAFHVDVPGGVDRLELEFQFASPQIAEQGRIVATPEISGCSGTRSCFIRPATIRAEYPSRRRLSYRRAGNSARHWM